VDGKEGKGDREGRGGWGGDRGCDAEVLLFDHGTRE